MEKLLQWCFTGCLLLLPVSCWQRNDIPSERAVQPEVATPPTQVETRAEPFDVQLNGVDYRIEPRFEYQMHGMVVSLRHHDGDRMIHRLWNDHLNVADVCVVWGSNATDLDLSGFDFWSGEFTCFVQTRDLDAWHTFDQNGLSNNHLITEDPYLRDLIEDLRIGDQISVGGWLAHYSNDDGFQRSTSITRTDRGNGACETIYINRFSILSSMDNVWRAVFDLSLYGAIAVALVWLIAVMRGGFHHRSSA